MYKRNSFITRYCLAVVVMLALLGPLAQNGWCNFILYDDEQLTVNSSHSLGALYDTSRAFIVSGGSVNNLYTNNSSTVNMSGGYVSGLFAYDSSTANISDGTDDSLHTYNSSTANISDGTDDSLHTYNSSTANISGGSVNYIYAYNSSTVIFYGQNFKFNGLDLVGERVLGTGILGGKWMDGTPWALSIAYNEPTATIRAIPEPATLLLLGLGAVMLRKRR